MYNDKSPEWWSEVLFSDEASVDLKVLNQEILCTKVSLGLAREILFVQDNAPAHLAKTTAKCLKDIKLKFLGHPRQSPDLNSIENI
ncbi:Tc1like transporase [Phytophthora megakarya]|uniref:Tc1like transporase n=1 Tax=Phytophthora megakarya TaxID=4795 RepID=A0A225WMW5_9STRA|nr:Tc1like transporase [Phytophthora megakarya]